MNKVLIVIAFLIVPFFASAQNDNKIEKTEVKTEVKAEINIKVEINQEFTIKKVDPISINPKRQNDKVVNFYCNLCNSRFLFFSGN